MARTWSEKGLAATLLVLTFALCLGPPVGSQEHNIRNPIVVEVHRTEGRLTFKLEPNPAPGKDILWGLSMLVEQRGPNYPLVAMVDDRAAIQDINQVPGIAAKAGFNKTRIFIVKRETGMMAEIKYCMAIPISSNPPPESACDSAKSGE